MKSDTKFSLQGNNMILKPNVSDGNIDKELIQKLTILLSEFSAILENEVGQQKIRRAIVRALMRCDLHIILDKQTIWIIAQKTNGGFQSIIWDDHRNWEYSPSKIQEMGLLDIGFDDPFVIGLPLDTLDQNTDQRANTLEAIANSYIEAERQRAYTKMNVIQINPIFGAASYVIDQRLAFTLMPFSDELTKIYKSLVQPAVESPEFNLVCKRADDIKSNRAIMQDIWKSICEARVIIADLTGLNPNVMYELGIAHTLGKDTILIYQKGENVNVPFDLSHIRRIEYENSAVGGQRLKQELKETLNFILNPSVII